MPHVRGSACWHRSLTCHPPLHPTGTRRQRIDVAGLPRHPYRVTSQRSVVVVRIPLRVVLALLLLLLELLLLLLSLLAFLFGLLARLFLGLLAGFFELLALLLRQARVDHEVVAVVRRGRRVGRTLVRRGGGYRLGVL